MPQMYVQECSSDSEEFFSACSDDSFVSVPSLADTLSCQFSDVPRNFNVVHINAQSIPAHFPDMLASFDCTHIHAILVSESWLKPCLSSSAYSLPGFHLIRNDRIGRVGGGVAIYLRTQFRYTIVSASPQPPPSNAGEHLFLEVEFSLNKVLLGVYYCPSLHINFFSSLEIILENLVPSYSQTIIMGDFNTCLLKNDHRSSSLLNTIQSCNLTTLPLSATHHSPNNTPSLLDLIFVSSINHVVKHGQYSADAFSCHDLLFLSYRLRPPKAVPKIVSQRNFRGINLDNLRKDADNIDWSLLFLSDCVDDKVRIFTCNLIELYNKHAPVRTVKIKHLPSPWLTDDIKVLLSKKASAKSRYNRRPNESNWLKYVAIRNHCSKVCRNAQRRHIHNSVENGDPAKVWKFLKSLGVGKSQQDSIPNSIDLNSLNHHFSSSSSFDKTIKENTIKHLSTLKTPNCSAFAFKQFAACDVKKTITLISSNAIGSDCVSRNMILPILDEILPIISHILNHSITTGTFPTAWKEAHIIPIPKKSNASILSEFRPISILPFLSKVLERLIHSQMSDFLSKNNLLNPLQSGFRPGHSTTTTLTHITDGIRSGMEEGKLTVLALLDFSNAFNTIDFDILLCMLRFLNISPTAVEWFRSYLYGRRQRICVEDSYSSWCSLSAGVPQGGVLSPLLFAVFINSISNNLRSSYHLYADDLQIYTRAPLGKINDAIAHINRDIQHICEWSKTHGLKVNPTKTQVIVIGSPRMTLKLDRDKLPPIYCDGTIVTFSDKVKNLGLYLDKSFTWGPQLQELSRKLFASARSLRRLHNLLPVATKISLAQTLLLPILDYADVSYPDLTEDQLNKLERLQNFIIRFIFGLRKYDHISVFRTKLKWLPIRLRRNAHILSLLYNILFNPLTPSYLKDRFVFLHDSHTRSLRSSESLELRMPVHSTTFMDKSFTVEAVRLWNALPVAVRRARSLTSFKKLVKDHYLSP